MNSHDDHELAADGGRPTVFGRGLTRAGTAVLLLAGATMTLSAQSLKGTVFQRDSVTRAPGVIVVVDDEGGNTVARALSGDNGGFDIKVPAPGRYTVRLLRIGFRPTVLAQISVPADGVSGLRAILGGEAVMLSAVTVRSENVCGTTRDAGEVIAQLWEEARKGLTATQLSVGARTLDVAWQVFRFEFVRRTSRVSGRVVSPRSGTTDRPFISASADSLANDGYVIDEEHERTFRAPDAAALLSDRFAATHCFRIDAPSRAHPQWVGISFRPTVDRDWIRDIEGTVWIDRASSELRLLEFTYTNLPRDIDVPDVGGFVEFARLGTGHWLIARWAIRAPKLVRPSRPSACGSGTRDGVTLRGSARMGGQAVRGAVVSVSWTPSAPGVNAKLSTVADELGAWTIPCAPAGTDLVVAASDGSRASPPVAVAAPEARTATRIELELAPPTRPE